MIRLAATVVAGLLLCASFPPYDLWYLSFLALALMAWVLIDQRTTPAGGFGYGMLAGLAGSTGMLIPLFAMMILRSGT